MKTMTKKMAFMMILGLATMAVAADWSVSPTSKTMVQSGGTFTLQTYINDCSSPLELVVSSDEDWLSIDDISGYLPLGSSVKVNVLANNSNKIHGRTGTINVNGYLYGQAHNYQNWMGRRTCNVFQYGVGASFSQDNVYLPGTNAVFSIDVFVKSGVSWTMTSPDWISILGGEGTGNGTITIIATENDSGDVRSGVIQIHDAGGDPSIPYSADNIYCIAVDQSLPPEKYALTYENTRGASNSNPSNYYQGASIIFDGLISVIDGYAFSGWTPAQINDTDCGDKIVTASWTPVNYTIAYDSNGGAGEMESTFTTYDLATLISSNAFTWANHRFIGWATNAIGDVVYAAGVTVSNLTSVADGVVTLYAKWEDYLDPPVFTPPSRTVFDDRLSISIACASPDATIHYTLDGTEPTGESPVYNRFRITDKTTVKAIAVLGEVASDIAVAEYAKGFCTEPVVSPADGSAFEHSNQEVSIAWLSSDGILRYTLDGSDPTAESPIYNGSFVISESTVVKAKVFSDMYFDSSVVTANLVRIWVDVPAPQINAASSFSGSKMRVSISCDMEDATIRYTLNGNDPNSHSTKYTGSFYVHDSCMLKAYASLPDYRNSAIATQEIVKVWGIGDTMGKPDHAFATTGDGGCGWVRVDEAAAPNGEAMKSGAITHNQTSILTTKVMGPGTLSFSWRASCEDDPDYEWDHAEFRVDGGLVRRICGETQWQSESIQVLGDGEHTIEWRYIKDDVESAGEDAVWVAGYGWSSLYTATRTSNVPVPYSWLMLNDPEIIDEYEIYEAVANNVAANGRKVWECYVVGLDPNDSTNDFRITSFPMKANGMPDLENIRFEPSQERWNVHDARPVLKGRSRLDAGYWQTVPEGGNPDFHFFRVEVELP